MPSILELGNYSVSRQQYGIKDVGLERQNTDGSEGGYIGKVKIVKGKYK